MSEPICHPRMTATRRTICEVHKELHDIVYEYIEDEDIRALALQKTDIVYDMAKRMDRKLKEYAYCIAKKEWRGWSYVNPYRRLIMFYRRMRKLGVRIPDPYRVEADDLKSGIIRDPKDGYIEAKDVWPQEYDAWKESTRKSS